MLLGEAFRMLSLVAFQQDPSHGNPERCVQDVEDTGDQLIPRRQLIPGAGELLGAQGTMLVRIRKSPGRPRTGEHFAGTGCGLLSGSLAQEHCMSVQEES